MPTNSDENNKGEQGSSNPAARIEIPSQQTIALFRSHHARLTDWHTTLQEKYARQKAKIDKTKALVIGFLETQEAQLQQYEREMQDLQSLLESFSEKIKDLEENPAV
ncbi:hypothetical protein PoHVEF18_002552 [Penicillium ochrochloron]